MCACVRKREIISNPLVISEYQALGKSLNLSRLSSQIVKQ